MKGEPGRPYTSFLLRCWLLDGRPHRVEVEHVQSGDHVQVSSLAAALLWVGTQWTGTHAPPLAPDTLGQPVAPSMHAQVTAHDLLPQPHGTGPATPLPEHGVRTQPEARGVHAASPQESPLPPAHGSAHADAGVGAKIHDTTEQPGAGAVSDARDAPDLGSVGAPRSFAEFLACARMTVAAEAAAVRDRYIARFIDAAMADGASSPRETPPPHDDPAPAQPRAAPDQGHGTPTPARGDPGAGAGAPGRHAADHAAPAPRPGQYGDGYLWGRLTRGRRIAEQDLYAPQLLEQVVDVFWDEQQRSPLVPPDRALFPRDVVLTLTMHDLLASRAFLPPDLYVFAPDLAWTIVFTHRTDEAGARLVLRCP